MALFPIIFAFTETLPVILYLCFIRRNKNEGLNLIFIYCLISLATEFLFLPLRHVISDFYVYAFFTVCEYSFLTVFLYLSLKSKKFRLIQLIGSLLFYTMAVINLTSKQSESFDSLSASVEALLIIIYSILFLYERIVDPSVAFVYQTKKFWIVIAFFLYFSSTLFLFIYAATLTKQEHKSYWYINDIFDIIKNILFCIAFVMKKGKEESYPFDNLYPDI
jgi:hypothetical protein